MNITHMRTIDRYLGVPLCWVLGLIQRTKTRRERPATLERILVIKFFGLGSIILSTPAISQLRTAYPGVAIDFLTFESNRTLLECYPTIDRILTLRTNSLPGFFADTLRLLLDLRRIPYDAVFDFEFFSKFSTLLVGITAAPMRVGFALPTRWRGMHLTHQVKLTKQHHVSEAFCEQVACLTGKKSLPGIIPPVICVSHVASMLEKVPLAGKRAIAINVNASSTFLERRWMPDRFAALASRLSEDGEREFFFLGNDEEREYVQHVIRMTTCWPRCHNIAGRLSIPELAAFLQRCELLISSDSGPVHLASALGTPVIGLYGPEAPRFYGPVGDETTTVYKSISCSPCMNVYGAKAFRCRYNARCMREIRVDEIQALAEELCITS